MEYKPKVYYDGAFKLISELYNENEELIGYFSLNFYDQYQLDVDIREEYQGRGLSKILLKNFALYYLIVKKEINIYSVIILIFVFYQTTIF